MKTLTMTWQIVDEAAVVRAYRQLKEVTEEAMLHPAFAPIEEMAEELVVYLDVYALKVNGGKPVGWLDLGLER